MNFRLFFSLPNFFFFFCLSFHSLSFTLKKIKTIKFIIAYYKERGDYGEYIYSSGLWHMLSDYYFENIITIRDYKTNNHQCTVPKHEILEIL